MAALFAAPDTAPLAVHLLGGLLVRHLGQTLPRPFQHRKTASLFSFLLLHPDRTYSRSYLAGTFWPDVDEDRARQSLRNSLVDIRRLLEPLGHGIDDILVSPKNMLQLQLPPDCWVDVWHFEDSVNRSLRVTPASDAWFESLEQAVGAYGGRLLPDNDDDWCRPLQDELQERLIACLHDLTSADRERGEYTRATEWARRAVAVDPTDEESHRDLMWLYHQMGERTRALRQYRELREALAEIGAAPDEQTLRLYQIIRSQRAPQRIPDRRRPPPLDYPHLWGPLVGRDRELAQLSQAWDRARTGRGDLLLLVGEPGIGKSRLGREMFELVVASGGLALYGQAYQSESDYLYQPLRDPLRRAIQLLEEQELTRPPRVWMRQVARLLPEIAQDDTDLTPPEAGSPGLLEGLTQFLLAVSAQRPIYLFLDDLQWADTATGQFLHYLSRRARSARLLLVGAYRAGELEDSPWVCGWVRDMSAQRLATALQLTRLTEEESVFLLEALAEGQASERFLRPLGHRLWQETGGNPLFLREQVRALFEERWLELTEDGRWRIASERLSESLKSAISHSEPRPLPWHLPVPETVQHVVEQRVVRLREDDRQLLACAAVIGRRFTLETLRVCVGWSLEPTLSGVERLLTANLLQAQTEPAALDFDHEMVREVLYEGLTTLRRQEWHGRVGEALERLYGLPNEEDPQAEIYPNWTRSSLRSRTGDSAERHAAELARHFHQSAPLTGAAKASQYYYLAGCHARDLGAHERAIRDLTAALSLLEELPPGEARQRQWGRIVEQLAPAYRGADQSEAARAVLEDFIERSEQQRDDIGVIRGVTFLGHLYERLPGGAGAALSRGMYERAVKECRARGLTEWFAYPSTQLAWMLVRTNCDCERGVLLAREALERMGGRGYGTTRRLAHTVLMWAAIKSFNWEEFEACFERSLADGGPQATALQLMLSELDEEAYHTGQRARFQSLCRRLEDGFSRAGLQPVLRQMYLAPVTPRGLSSRARLSEHFDGPAWSPELRWQDSTARSHLDRTTRPGWLGIHPAKDCDLWPDSNLHAPRLMTRAGSDFVAETLIELGQETAVRGGLLLWQDGQHFVRLELHGRDVARSSVALQACVNGWFQHVGGGFCDRKPMRLRLERIGDEIRGLCSEDGQQWYTAGQVQMPRGDSEEVGIAAIYVGANAHAWFDYFWVMEGSTA